MQHASSPGMIMTRLPPSNGPVPQCLVGSPIEGRTCGSPNPYWPPGKALRTSPPKGPSLGSHSSRRRNRIPEDFSWWKANDETCSCPTMAASTWRHFPAPTATAGTPCLRAWRLVGNTSPVLSVSRHTWPQPLTWQCQNEGHSEAPKVPKEDSLSTMTLLWPRNKERSLTTCRIFPPGRSTMDGML